MRLFEMIDLADMPGGCASSNLTPLQCPSGRKAPALDHRHLMRHVRMHGIVSDRVDAGLRYNAMLSSKANLSTIWGTAYNATVFLAGCHSVCVLHKRSGFKAICPADNPLMDSPQYHNR
jgi:hypothetical protein